MLFSFDRNLRTKLKASNSEQDRLSIAATVRHRHNPGALTTTVSAVILFCHAFHFPHSAQCLLSLRTLLTSALHPRSLHLYIWYDTFLLLHIAPLVFPQLLHFHFPAALKIGSEHNNVTDTMTYMQTTAWLYSTGLNVLGQEVLALIFVFDRLPRLNPPKQMYNR